MIIAFASCFDAIEDSEQKVWMEVRSHNPEVLLLLDDSVYMDYFPHLYRSRGFTSQQFADDLYTRYSAQWRVSAFRDLVGSVPNVGITWDDHDFAWNGSCGKGQSPNHSVPREKRLISCGLFVQFRNELRRRPLTSAYPAQPSLNALLATPDLGVEESFDYGGIRFIMLDGRSFREDQKEDLSSSMIGQVQRQWLSHQIENSPGVTLIGSGSTLSKSKESWDNYADYEWLMNQGYARTIVFSGDIHKNAYHTHSGQRDLLEIISSGAARPGFGGATGNYGVVNINGNNVAVGLFDRDGEHKKNVTL